MADNLTKAIVEGSSVNGDESFNVWLTNIDQTQRGEHRPMIHDCETNETKSRSHASRSAVADLKEIIVDP
jgi:hypothetical protein